MTIPQQTEPSVPFKAAHAIFSKATLARQCPLAEADREAIEDLIDPLFEALLNAPAVSLEDLAAKAESIMSEYGQGDCIPSRMLKALMADFRGLARSHSLD